MPSGKMYETILILMIKINKKWPNKQIYKSSICKTYFVQTFEAFSTAGSHK